MRFKRLILFILIGISTFDAFSQSREAGIAIGLMGYRGDLDPTMYDLTYIDPGIGILYRRSYSNHWAFKAAINYGRIQATDENADDFWSRNRNLNFRSNILEATGQIEFNFLPYQTASPFTKWSPYLMAGFTVFRFNPKGKLNDDWIELQPLGTEGQGIEGSSERIYRRTALAFTFGGGFKFKVSRRFGITIESGVRQTYTDYLDDVSTEYYDPIAIRKEYGKAAEALSDRSLEKAPGGNIGRQRGDRSKRDYYVFTSVQITYTLSKKYIDNCRPFRIKLW
jgi:hypothetical protein